jgi:hypothetical protein
MVRPGKDDLQVERDLRRAYALIERLRGLSAEDSVAALHDHAVLTDVSIHEAALAVLAEWRPPGGSRRQIPASHVYTTADRTGRVLVRWQGREKAHVAVSGIGSDDLAGRLRRAVEPALRAGATHLVIDTRGTSGVTPGFDDVLSWAGRRLWARRGSSSCGARTSPRPSTRVDASATHEQRSAVARCSPARGHRAWTTRSPTGPGAPPSEPSR